MVELIVLVGPPASSKSSWAQKMSEREGYSWVSSDNIRKNYDYDISNADVFAEMFSITEANLRMGVNVIYDATNLSAKRRKHLIDCIKSLKMNDIVLFRCEVFVAPIDMLKERNANRSGADCVPEEVINRMVKNFQFPQYFEGWDFININDNSVGQLIRFGSMKDYDQHSKYHSLDLYEHSRAVVEKARKLNLPMVVADAAWYHDIGKPFCRTEGKDGWAHYFGHENVSAYMLALDYVDSGYYSKDAFLSMIFIVNYHMRPYNWTQKSYEKDMNTFGEEYTHMLKLFHQCDITAH